MTGNGPQFAFLARGAYQVIQQKDATFHVGFNYANLFDPSIGPNLQAVSLSDRPELRIDPTSFFTTGNIPASGGQVFGAEVAASYKNFFAQGEYYHYIVDTRAACRPRRAICKAALPAHAQFRRRISAGELQHRWCQAL